VTIASFSDLWLAEGQATWYEREYVADKLGGDFEQFMRDEYAIADQLRDEFGPVARPKNGDPDVLFSDNVYGGGALVLFALHEKIGDRQWRGLERAWAQENAGRSLSTDDWIAFVNRYTHRNLTAFLRDWVYGTKVPAMPGHPGWTTGAPAPAAKRAPAVAQFRRSR
jgi:aminopeptidase N